MEYFRHASDADAAWAVYFLCGRRRKRLVPTQLLREWVAARAGVPAWLFEESYHHVGDLAETAALLLPESDPPPGTPTLPLADFVERHVLALADEPPERQRETVEACWAGLSTRGKLVYHKLLTGGFRVGVQRKTVENALGELHGIEPAVVAHRMMGRWEPSATWFAGLRRPGSPEGEPSLPYPFCLAHPVDRAKRGNLGPVNDWRIEPKWDGIRAQLIRRRGQVFLWSRGGESVSETFPEILGEASALPDGTVLDGEILVWKHGGRPESFGELQKRLGRKTVPTATLRRLPARFLAYDLLESGGTDRRDLSTTARRDLLEHMLAGAEGTIRLSPVFRHADWAGVAERVAAARDAGIEGVMLKRRDAPYAAGRPRGLWWKWKVDPLSVDAVLVYAQGGHGRRSGLFTDYTFSVRAGEGLVPVAKAYSGLSDKEIRELDRWIKANTVDKFGPVRAVPPEQVFELAFDSIRESKRHKAGLALRFPRIVRWRRDKGVADIDRIETLRGMMDGGSATSADKGISP